MAVSTTPAPTAVSHSTDEACTTPGTLVNSLAPPLFMLEPLAISVRPFFGVNRRHHSPFSSLAGLAPDNVPPLRLSTPVLGYAPASSPPGLCSALVWSATG